MTFTAFFLTDSLDEHQYSAGRDHLAKLCAKHNHTLLSLKRGPYRLYLARRDNFCRTQSATTNQHQCFPNSDSSSFLISSCNANKREADRFLLISISGDEISFTTDYAGSVPLYYSQRKSFNASNIEPIVTLETQSSLEDLDWPSIYGFLRFSHLIWDETCWKHIKQALPDNKLSYDYATKKISLRKLKTLRSTDSHYGLSDKEVACRLYELNQQLISDAFEDISDFILPLSSGYDSRIIFSALVDNGWQNKFHCFTYGSRDSIESYAAFELCERAGVKWEYVDLPCRFLEPPNQQEIIDIFGSSLHMHGMYQVEFIKEIGKMLGKAPSCVTSGFMTGVPAGQHNSFLSIDSTICNLSERMSRFSQSNYWLKSELAALGIFDIANCEELAEARFRAAFDYHEGPVEHKAVLFDVWTRQRNFISYYPRTIEWLAECISPHMNPAYAGFFLGLAPYHLNDRKAVELMFRYCYSVQAKTISNSNRRPFMAGSIKNLAARLYQSRAVSNRYVRRAIPISSIPEWLKLGTFDLDMNAVSSTGAKTFYQFDLAIPQISEFLQIFEGSTSLRRLCDFALRGSPNAYSKCLALQSLCGSLALGNVR